MKLSILSLAFLAIFFSSCSTAYKTGQTPDDVYFSPAKPADEYVVVQQEDDRTYRGGDYYEDRYLRNRIRNPYRYSVLDDYYNNPYAYNSFGYYSSWNNPWNNYWTWNSYYNPYHYGGGIIVKNPGNYRPPSRAIVFNPSSYSTNSTLSSRNYHPGSTYNPNNSAARYNNSNSNNRNNQNNGTLGSSLRRVFSNSGSSNNSNSRSDNSSNSTPTRSYTPSTTTSSQSNSGSSGRSSSSSSSSGGSRPIR